MSKTVYEVIVKVEKSGNRYNAFDTDGVKRTSEISTGTRKRAFENNQLIGRYKTTTGRNYWRLLDIDESEIVSDDSATTNDSVLDTENTIVEVPEEHEAVVGFIHSSYSLKPTGLKMKELKWKYLMRSAVRGKNIMMTGPSGCGKTLSAKALVNSLDRPDYYFNLGATQDPRSTLIGNTHYNSEKGTYFSESAFVKAIQTEDAVILLDELSRAHPDAWNILMTVLDYGQRYLRLDEQDGQKTINVAKGVTFVATANIGNEYTSTRVMDKALMDRFTIVEMDVLDEQEEGDLLGYMFPQVDKTTIGNIAKIANMTRVNSKSDTATIANGISTRTSVEMAGLLYDGFDLNEAAEVSVYPQYSDDGGVDSERTFVKQIVQKFVSDGSDEDLFTDDEISDTVNN